jgi:hypothetical protein
MTYHQVFCPYCKEIIIIEDIACGIFRHAIFKDTYQQIPPHSPKEFCDLLRREEKILGCGYPFKVIFIKRNIAVEDDNEEIDNKDINVLIAVECDYI